MTVARNRPGHDRCGADTGHGPCGLTAGWGTGHVGIGACRKHGGSTPNHVAAARKVQAAAECERWGLPITTTAGDALQAELARTYGRATWLADRVSRLTEADLYSTPWVTLEQWERRHLAELARGMVALDLDGRQVALTELFGRRLADALDRALGGAGVSAGQRAHVLQLLPGALDRGTGA